MDSDSSCEAHSITEEILRPCSEDELHYEWDSSEVSSPEEWRSGTRSVWGWTVSFRASRPPVVQHDEDGARPDTPEDERDQNRLLNTDWWVVNGTETVHWNM